MAMNSFGHHAKDGAYDGGCGGGGGSGSGIDWPGGVSAMTETEKQVVEILLQLPQLILKSDFVFTWGAKKTRLKRMRRLVNTAKKDPENGDLGPTPTPEEPSSAKQWTDASSPDTPLISSFSPSGPEQKLSTKRKFVKRRREDGLVLVTQLEKERDLLKREIENMRGQMDQAMATNALLKRKQHELIICQEREKNAKLGEVNTSLTLGSQWTQHSTVVSSSSSSPPSSSSSSSTATVRNPGVLGIVDQQQPLILNRAVVLADKSSSLPAEMRSLLVKLNAGPQHLPDLNLPVDECHVSGDPQPLDLYVDKKFMATLARQNRCRIYKAKTSVAASRKT